MKSDRDRQAGSGKVGPTILDGFLTTEELAEEIGVHRTTLAKWRMERRGPPFTRLGKRILYSVERLRAWLEANETSSIPDLKKERR
ncbi:MULTISPECIES: helix-turn-helix domain-containing protein [Pelagibacterium]|uniref:DNA binding domain-containing protein, excisionase family n=1 Tax=Pelagibacterium luteolum TaxID=440168 RepID=A0A1G7WPJ9_9HYPH|nr:MULTISPECIES: helix-turn-helix domain-containing protein [Pelagibacterium]SDG73842.1 DNA binding domain-containing protein, excisionase family [Pelagibacterium luteolum]